MKEIKMTWLEIAGLIKIKVSMMYYSLPKDMQEDECTQDSLMIYAIGLEDGYCSSNSISGDEFTKVVYDVKQYITERLITKRKGESRQDFIKAFLDANGD